MIPISLRVINNSNSETREITTRSDATTIQLKGEIIRIFNVQNFVLILNGRDAIEGNDETLEEKNIKNNDEIKIMLFAPSNTRQEEAKKPQIISLFIRDEHQNQVQIRANPEWSLNELQNELKSLRLAADDSVIIFNGKVLDPYIYGNFKLKKIKITNLSTLRVLKHHAGGNIAGLIRIN